jgi:hypothetical protein
MKTIRQLVMIAKSSSGTVPFFDCPATSDGSSHAEFCGKALATIGPWWGAWGSIDQMREGLKPTAEPLRQIRPQMRIQNFFARCGDVGSLSNSIRFACIHTARPPHRARIDRAAANELSLKQACGATDIGLS